MSDFFLLDTCIHKRVCVRETACVFVCLRAVPWTVEAEAAAAAAAAAKSRKFENSRP